ncbi:SCP2 sterol-binding domain-containing protein [Wukongibacter sp. M2B1]|uniref:SCP2 sterol-binding domain-containing protein n=1 Tax=Wukongibacter sp. M2B1 TaxID=3088895 RepID=UPI003D7A60F9
MCNMDSKEQTYRNHKKFWGVITTMMDELNAEQKEQQFIPEDLELRVGYKMDDIKFDHTVIIKDGHLLAEEGLGEETDVIISMSSQTFHDINMGKLNPMKAFTSSLFEFEKGDVNQIALAGNMPTMLYYRKACEIHGIE